MRNQLFIKQNTVPRIEIKLLTCNSVARDSVVPFNSRSSSSVNQSGFPNVVGSISRYLNIELQCINNTDQHWHTNTRQNQLNVYCTYGFQEEFFRRCSMVRNKIIKNLSSTSPSSSIALHSGPRIGSWSTLIGVIARSSGTTSRSPEIHNSLN